MGDVGYDGTRLFGVQGRLPDKEESTGPVYTNTVTKGTETQTLQQDLKYGELIKISVHPDDYATDGTGTDVSKKKSIDSVELKSSFYIQSLNFDADKKTGTRLDLQNGKYTSYGKYGRIEIASSAETFFRLADADNKVLFLIKAESEEPTDDDKDNDPGTEDKDGDTKVAAKNVISKYYLKSSTYDSKKRLGTKLDLQNGKFVAYGKHAEDKPLPGYVIIDTNGDGIFRVGGIGKDTQGNNKLLSLIYVGTGDKYFIQNVSWALSADGTSKRGTKWNLATGQLSMYGEGGKVDFQPDESDKLLCISGTRTKSGTAKDVELMHVGTDEFFLQSYDYGNSSGSSQKGMRINLETGNLVSKNTGGQILIQPDDEDALFVVKTSNDKTIMNVGKDDYYLQSSDYNETTHKGMKFDLGGGTSSGKITAFNFQVDAYSSDGTKFIKINSGASDYPFNVNDKFLIEWDGSTILKGNATLTVESGIIQSGADGDTKGKYYSLNQKGGKIGGWYLTENSLQSYDPDTDSPTYSSKLGADGTILLDGKGWTMELDSADFTIGRHSYKDDFNNAYNTSFKIGYSQMIFNNSTNALHLDSNGLRVDGTITETRTNYGLYVGRPAGAYGTSATARFEAVVGDTTKLTLSTSSINLEAGDTGIWLSNAGFQMKLDGTWKTGVGGTVEIKAYEDDKDDKGSFLGIKVKSTKKFIFEDGILVDIQDA
jgi:hypothetical protein